MSLFPTKKLSQLALLSASSLLLISNLAIAESHSHDDKHADHDHSHSSEHKHEHKQKNEKEKSVYNGYFEDDQIKARALSDWEGDWQSVYPYLMDGTLQPVMEKKAESSEMTAEEYREYYEIGYKTDVQRIEIDAAEDSDGGSFTFHQGDTSAAAQYAYDGHEVLTYKKGNRGVRYIFAKTEGDDNAPDYVQFSDHAIAPNVADHYHLYWGDDRAALLEEVTNWPTYYKSNLDAQEILNEMLAH